MELSLIGDSGHTIFLAAQVLKRYNPKVYLTGKLENSHRSILRCRDPKMLNELKIPYEEIKISKGIIYNNQFLTECNLKLNNIYSQKVNKGVVRGKSILNIKDDIRYQPSGDMFELLTKGIEYNENVNWKDIIHSNKLIASCLDINQVMKELNINNIYEYGKHFKIWIVTVDILEDIGIYQTLYYLGSEPYYRVSLEMRKLTVEFIQDPFEFDMNDLEKILLDFGINAKIDRSSIILSGMEYGKMVNMQDNLRKGVIGYLTEKYNIFSFGRKGLWKSILLEDVYEDLLKMKTLIDNKIHVLNLNL